MKTKYHLTSVQDVIDCCGNIRAKGDDTPSCSDELIIKVTREGKLSMYLDSDSFIIEEGVSTKKLLQEVLGKRFKKVKIKEFSTGRREIY